MRLFPRVIPIGVRHGTVQVHTRLRSIEVTSCPAGEREGILADLKRRDFTVNALALSYPAGVLLDPYGGQEDLLAGSLRAVEDAPSRFREDPLRTLRAGRFISVYGFRIESRTFAALQEAAPGLAGRGPGAHPGGALQDAPGEVFPRGFRGADARTRHSRDSAGVFEGERGRGSWSALCGRCRTRRQYRSLESLSNKGAPGRALSQSRGGRRAGAAPGKVRAEKLGTSKALGRQKKLCNGCVPLNA